MTVNTDTAMTVNADDKSLVVEGGPDVRFFYFDLGKTKASAAFILDENREAKVRQVQCAFAFCRSGDQFLKSKGRMIAEARLIKHPHRMTIPLHRLNEDGKPTFVVEQIKDHLRDLITETLRAKPLETWTAKPQPQG